MKSYFIFELKYLLKNRKTLFMIGLLFVIFGAVFYGIHNQGLGNQRKKLDEELNQTRILSQHLQQYNVENEEELALSWNLSQQQQILASQANGLTFQHSEWYLESGLELAKLRLEMHESESFSELPTSLFPSEDSMYRALVELETLQENSVPIMGNSESVSGFVRESLSAFGFIAFGYLLVFGSDILMDDFDHGTMIKSYPITSLQKYLSKLIIYSTSIVVITGIVWIITATLTSFIWETGNFKYPVGVYFLGDFQALPLWGEILLFFLYYFVLAIHVMLLAMILNIYLKNSIATIIIGFILFLTPYFYSPAATYFSLLPFHYYNLTSLLNGKFAMEVIDFMDVGVGALILSLYSFIFICIIFRKDKRQTLSS